MLFTDRLTVNLPKARPDLGELNVTPTNNLMVDTRSATSTSSLPTRSASSCQPTRSCSPLWDADLACLNQTRIGQADSRRSR
jgi:hypothetical protein